MTTTLLVLCALCLPAPRELRDPFSARTSLRDPFRPNLRPAPELRDPFPPQRDLKAVLPLHPALKIPDELR